ASTTPLAGGKMRCAWKCSTASHLLCRLFFFFNDTATTEIYPLSLHDALPICRAVVGLGSAKTDEWYSGSHMKRSEEHTSELQSHLNLVCRLLLEKKKRQM